MLSPSESSLLHIMCASGEPKDIDDLLVFFLEFFGRWEKFLGYPLERFLPALGWFGQEVDVPSEAETMLSALPPPRRREVAESFLRWNRHPQVREFANPYEPLLLFFHHGGSWSRPENGILSVYDSKGGYAGVLTSTFTGKKNDA